MLLLLSDLEAGHLARAIRAYGDRLRLDGLRMPAGLVELEVRLTASVGQRAPKLDGSEGLPDDVPVMPILIETRAAADALSLSERAVARLISSGALPSIKVGRRRLVHRADLVEFAEGLRGEERDATKD